MSADVKDFWGILVVIILGLFLIPGCSMKVGRLYKEPRNPFCAPCFINDKGTGGGIVFFQGDYKESKGD